MRKLFWICLIVLNVWILCSCGLNDITTNETTVITSQPTEDSNQQTEPALQQKNNASSYLLKSELTFDAKGQEIRRETYEYDNYFVLRGLTVYFPVSGISVSGLYCDHDVNLNPHTLRTENYTTKLIYDANGNVIEAQEYDESGELTTLHVNTYDKSGRLVESRGGYVGGNNPIVITTTYKYESDEIYYKCYKDGKTEKIICEYDINGNKIRETSENGWTEYQWILKIQNNTPSTEQPGYSQQETSSPIYIPPATTHTHSYGEWQSDSVTNHARYCSCGEKQTEAHTYGAGVITKEATESSEGIKKFTCKKCNYFKEEIIPVIVPVLSKEELEQQKLDQAGILPENRYDTYTPEVTLTGYMKDSMTFVLDEKIALKGYWEKDRWDILEEVYVALHYNLEKGKRYTLSGTLRYYDLGDVQIVEELE